MLPFERRKKEKKLWKSFALFTFMQSQFTWLVSIFASRLSSEHSQRSEQVIDIDRQKLDANRQASLSKSFNYSNNNAFWRSNGASTNEKGANLFSSFTEFVRLFSNGTQFVHSIDFYLSLRAHFISNFLNHKLCVWCSKLMQQYQLGCCSRHIFVLLLMKKEFAWLFAFLFRRERQCKNNALESKTLNQLFRIDKHLKNFLLSRFVFQSVFLARKISLFTIFLCLHISIIFLFVSLND